MPGPRSYGATVGSRPNADIGKVGFRITSPDGNASGSAEGEMPSRFILGVAVLAAWTATARAQRINAPARTATNCYVNTFRPVPNEAKAPELVECPSPEYPPASYAVGAQGGVMVEAVVTKTGTVSSPRIANSIVPPELEAAALKAVSLAKFRPALDVQGASLEVPFLMSVEFAKDDPKNVQTKLCSDFVTDAQWFKARYPQMKLHEMHLYYVVVARLGTDGFEHHVEPSEAQEAGQRLLPAFDAAFEQCAATPEANFLSTLRGLAKIDW
jgi:TonB family protein